MLGPAVHLLGFQTISMEGRPSTGRTRAGRGGWRECPGRGWQRPRGRQMGGGGWGDCLKPAPDQAAPQL